MEVFLVELLFIFAGAVVLGIVFRYFGLPSIIGQVLLGLVVGISGILSGEEKAILELMGSLGITLLLFLVGLEMSWTELERMGKAVIVNFVGQTLGFMLLFGLVGRFILNLELTPAIFFAIAMSFCSTIVVVKVLSEKRDLGSYAGRLSLGILLLQDILAIALMVFIPNIGKSVGGYDLLLLGLKLFGLFLSVNIVGEKFVNLVMKKFIKSPEDLILFSLSWFLLVVYLSKTVLGLSAEIGGFLAGLSLSNTWGHFQIVSKVKTLRDIFLTIFFVLLGLQVGGGKVDWILVIVLTLLVVFGKMFVALVWARCTGFYSRSAFLLSVNMTQISEFSMIVIAVGLTYGFWGNDIAKVVTITGLLSMTISTILISEANVIYGWLRVHGGRFFKFKRENNPPSIVDKDHVVLIGCDRTGRSILAFLKKTEIKLVVVDFNPEMVKSLREKGEQVIFADVADPDIFELTNIAEAKLVISTIKDVNDSVALLQEIKNRNLKVPVVVEAETPAQASELYKAGASYVVFPHYVGGLHLGQILKKMVKDGSTLERYKKRQVDALKTIYEGEY